jgi:hypothetical protein
MGRGHDYLVPGATGGHDGLSNALLGTITNNDLFGRVGGVVFACKLGADGLTQIAAALVGRVAGKAIVQGRNSGIDDRLGSPEVGLSGGKLNHRLALLAHGASSVGELGGARRWNAPDCIAGLGCGMPDGNTVAHAPHVTYMAIRTIQSPQRRCEAGITKMLTARVLMSATFFKNNVIRAHRNPSIPV